MNIRMPAVSGTFYPASQQELSSQLQGFFQHCHPHPLPAPPAMLIVPHAGYIYSGQVAAEAYNLLAPYTGQVQRVILLGPSHRVPLAGIAVINDDRYRTPLGDVQLDREAAAELLTLSGVDLQPLAHRFEHSLEVQLPFLQSLLDDFLLLPLVVGQTQPERVVQVLAQLWQPGDLIVISTDLSHFLADEAAKIVDAETITKIINMETDIQGEQACGCYGLNGALQFARQQHWHIEPISHCNSGDVSGKLDSVVGYASFALYADKTA